MLQGFGGVAHMSAHLHAVLSDHLERIACLHKERPRITLIVRVPGKPNQGVFLSDDNWTEAIAQVNYLNGAAAYVAGPPEPAPSAPAMRRCEVKG